MGLQKDTIQHTFIIDDLTAKEVAKRMRCGLTTVYEMDRRGDLKCFRAGKVKGIRISRGSLDELMRRKTKESGAECTASISAEAPQLTPGHRPRPRRKTLHLDDFLR